MHGMDHHCFKNVGKDGCLGLTWSWRLQRSQLHLWKSCVLLSLIQKTGGFWLVSTWCLSIGQGCLLQSSII